MMMVILTIIFLIITVGCFTYATISYYLEYKKEQKKGKNPSPISPRMFAGLSLGSMSLLFTIMFFLFTQFSSIGNEIKRVGDKLGDKIDGVGDKIDRVSDKIDRVSDKLSDKIDKLSDKIDGSRKEIKDEIKDSRALILKKTK